VKIIVQTIMYGSNHFFLYFHLVAQLERLKEEIVEIIHLCSVKDHHFIENRISQN